MASEINLNNNGLEEYPWSVVIMENLEIAVWIFLGTFLIAGLSEKLGIVYLSTALLMILVIMRKLLCTRCYYYGKRCHVGWGKISAAFFKQGDISEFSACAGSKIAPVFFGLLALVPILSGAIVMFKNPSLTNGIALFLLLAAVIHSSVFSRKKSCGQCKMNLVCPASAAK